jgi:internalin A
MGAWGHSFLTRGGSHPLNEAKLILVGRGGVGKTCVVNRLVRDRFDSNEKKSDGIRITRWNVRLSATDEVRLHIWDFGGQEIMHSTHQVFLSQRSLYLLVLTGREGGEDADAEYWLQLIESFGGESPVIVVLNKIKEQHFDLNRRALQQRYPSIRDFVATDCGHEKAGLDKLDAVIRRETEQLEGLRDSFPASWFKIKDRLASMKENYLSFERYRELCENMGEQDSDAQERLAGYLHKLGLALNFKDDPRLRDTHVLNPHWITNGIYTILNAESLAKQKGIIRLTKFGELLILKE